jgi:hypothetical protein
MDIDFEGILPNISIFMNLFMGLWNMWKGNGAPVVSGPSPSTFARPRWEWTGGVE